jgi:hypothetical protein
VVHQTDLKAGWQRGCQPPANRRGANRLPTVAVPTMPTVANLLPTAVPTPVNRRHPQCQPCQPLALQGEVGSWQVGSQFEGTSWKELMIGTQLDVRVAPRLRLVMLPPGRPTPPG